MKIFVFFTNRLIKVLGALVKLVAYVFHFVFPNKRFVIPLEAEPLIARTGHRAIPEILWQTNFTNRVSLPVYLNYLFNRLMAPTYEYRYMGDEQMLDFVKANYAGRTAENYARVSVGAAKADFWRLLVLKKHGGVYMDMDAQLVWPLPLLVKASYDELYVESRPGHYTNYFLASKENNPNIDKAIAIVNENIERGDSPNVYELTGPPNINKAVAGKKFPSIFHRYVCIQGSFTNEHFQYIDRPRGKWTYAKKDDLLAK